MKKSHLIAVFFFALAAACADRTLVGPEAQEAYLEAAERLPDLPWDVLVLVDGVEVSSDTIFDVLSADQIARIEVIKGAMAAELYGEDNRLPKDYELYRGVIQIVTTKATADLIQRVCDIDDPARAKDIVKDIVADRGLTRVCKLGVASR